MRMTVMVSILLMALIESGTAGAASFVDNFNRSDGNLGADWTNYGGNPQITSNVVVGALLPDAIGSNAVISAYTAAGSVLDNDFTITSDLWATTNAPYVGLAWHVEDADNFYWFRTFLGKSNNNNIIAKVVGGSQTILTLTSSSGDMSALLVNDSTTVTLTGTTAGDYTITLTDGVTSWSAAFSDITLSGGHAGYYAFGNATSVQAFHADDFTLTIVPEPATVALLGIGGLIVARRSRPSVER